MGTRMIVVDMDGTLLYEGNKIGPLNKDYLRRLSNQGYLVVLASGRPWRSMKPYYEMLECNGPAICYNGALVFDPKNPDFPVISRLFSKEILMEIAQKGRSFITSFMAEDLEDIFISRQDHHLQKYFWYQGMNVHEGDMTKIISKDTYTALFRCTHAHDKELEEIVAAYPGIELRHWTRSFYSELAFTGMDKGAGLAHIRDYYGLAKEDIYAFGDADNDYSMLALSGHPFAMKGCKSEKLAAAFPMTKKGDAQSGVALQLLELFDQ